MFVAQRAGVVGAVGAAGQIIEAGQAQPSLTRCNLAMEFHGRGNGLSLIHISEPTRPY